VTKLSEEFSALSMTDRPTRDGSWSLIIVTMLFVAYGVWSWYQIQDLKELRIEVQELRSQVNEHQVELAKQQIRLDDVEDE
jgi:hypothetical protein